MPDVRKKLNLFNIHHINKQIDNIGKKNSTKFRRKTNKNRYNRSGNKKKTPITPIIAPAFTFETQIVFITFIIHSLPLKFIYSCLER